MFISVFDQLLYLVLERVRSSQAFLCIERVQREMNEKSRSPEFKSLETPDIQLGI